MAEKHNRNDNGRKPDVWKIHHGAVRLFKSDLLEWRRKSGDRSDYDIKKKNQGKYVPDY
jgi:hypothetical protein